MSLATLRRIVSDLGEFSRVAYPDHALRRYQLEAALPVVAAVEAGGGGEFCVLFSRQAGKDELLAQLQAFLLMRRSIRGGSIVVGAPTFKPQCLVSRRRLAERCQTPLHHGAATTEGYRVVVGRAGVSFLSAEPTANVRGETADVLLIANEAQDITTDRWDSTFAPMAASTNAPAVYSGTPWLSGSLLSRERHICRQMGTLYEADWQRVAEEVPAYGEYVRGQIAKLGEGHPFIRSEYELQELGSEGGLFPSSRRAQMRGDHPRRSEREGGKQYALLVDVAGEDEDASDEPGQRGKERRRDSTAMTVVEIDTATVSDPLIALPRYRVVDRHEWVGTKHTALYARLSDLARSVWRARFVVVDATGIGAGLASFLSQALSAPGRCDVVPFVFSLKSKSDLGWQFVGCIESGRYKEYLEPVPSLDTGRFWDQVANTEYTADPGPGKVMRWGVPESKGHDDLVVSAALVGALDELDWRPRVVSARRREDIAAGWRGR